jgi:hypothetical protein
MEVEKHPERVRAFRAASLQGWAYAMEHPEEIMNLIVTKYKTKDAVESLWNEYNVINNELMLPKLIEIGHMNPGRWQHIGDTFVSLGMLQPDYSLEGFLYDPNPKADYTLTRKFVTIVGIIFLVVLLSVLILLIFNRQLKIKVRKRTQALKESEIRNKTLISPLKKPYFTE